MDGASRRTRPCCAVSEAERGASAAELQAFHDAIYTAYRRDYSGDVPVLHRMREMWNYLAGSSRNTEPLLRAVRKARTCAAYEQAVRPFFARAEMIRE